MAARKRYRRRPVAALGRNLCCCCQRFVGCAPVVTDRRTEQRLRPPIASLGLLVTVAVTGPSIAAGSRRCWPERASPRRRGGLRPCPVTLPTPSARLSLEGERSSNSGGLSPESCRTVARSRDGH